MKPLLKFRGTTFLGAFAMQAMVSTFTVVLGLAMDNLLRDVNSVWRTTTNIAITFLSTFIVLLLAHIIFGYGAALVDNTTTNKRLAFQPISG